MSEISDQQTEGGERSERSEEKNERVLVLDLDQTLINCTEYCRQDVDPEHKHHEIVDGGELCHEHYRPFVAEFFTWIKEKGYQIIIWSAVVPSFLVKRVELLKKHFGIEVLGCLSAVDITWGDKDLEVVCKKFNLKMGQVLAVDDAQYNYHMNKGKCIYIRPWFGLNLKDQELMNICKHITSHFEQNKQETQKEDLPEIKQKAYDSESSYVQSIFSGKMFV